MEEDAICEIEDVGFIWEPAVATTTSSGCWVDRRGIAGLEITAPDGGTAEERMPF